MSIRNSIVSFGVAVLMAAASAVHAEVIFTSTDDAGMNDPSVNFYTTLYPERDCQVPGMTHATNFSHGVIKVEKNGETASFKACWIAQNGRVMMRTETGRDIFIKEFKFSKETL